MRRDIFVWCCSEFKEIRRTVGLLEERFRAGESWHNVWSSRAHHFCEHFDVSSRLTCFCLSSGRNSCRNKKMELWMHVWSLRSVVLEVLPLSYIFRFPCDLETRAVPKSAPECADCFTAPDGESRRMKMKEKYGLGQGREVRQKPTWW